MAELLFNLTSFTREEANLRAQPRVVSGNVLAVVPRGAQIQLGGNSRDWLLVRYGAQQGYIASWLVQDAWRQDGAWTSVVVDTDELNVRPDASATGTPVGALTRGATLAVLGVQGDWLRILYEGAVAYVRASYTDLAPAATPDAAAPAAVEVNAAALTIDELRSEHFRIHGLGETTARGDAYEALQARAPYYSQRDNQARDGSGALIETEGGRMCNLTALAMALSFLGCDNPHPELQYEDALEKVRVDRGLPARTTAAGWGGVANARSVDVVFVKGSPFTESRTWWKDTVRGLLRDGMAVMMSISGHIVRVQAVSDAGLVVDDPYGRSTLEAGTGYSFEDVNPYQSTGTLVGPDVVWPWDQVEAHTMRWLARLYIKLQPMSWPPQPNYTALPDISEEETSNPRLQGIRPRVTGTPARAQPARLSLDPSAVRARAG